MMSTTKITEEVRLVEYPNDIGIQKLNSFTGAVHKIWLNPDEVEKIVEHFNNKEEGENEMNNIFKVKFEGIENVPEPERSAVDYSLVANQMGEPKARFIENQGEYSVYEAHDVKEFLMELGRIEMIYEEVTVEVKQDECNWYYKKE